MTAPWPLDLALEHKQKTMDRLLVRLFTAHSFPDSFQAIHDLIARGRHLLPFVGYPLRDRQVRQPVFIVGSGRSGNTLLRRILCAHPSVHLPPETYRLGPAIKLFRQNRNLDWKHLVHLVLSEFEYHPQFDAFRVSLRPLALRLLEVPRDSRSLATILDGFYRYHAEANGKPEVKMWGDKTPLNIYWLNTIRAVLPQARVIHIIRDGCDVVSSYMQSGLITDAAAAGERWTTAVQAGERFAARHPESCLRLSYEDLVTRPAEVTQQVCAFLDIAYQPAMIESTEVAQTMGDVPLQGHHRRVKEPISGSSVGKGRRELDDETRRMLQNQIGPLLERLGYPPCI